MENTEFKENWLQTLDYNYRGEILCTMSNIVSAQQIPNFL